MKKQFSNLQKLHGSNDPLPKVTMLRAGRLTVEYTDGALRNISYNGLEVIRMIYVAVRDQVWLNIPQKIVKENIITSENGFEIRFSVLYTKNEIEFFADFLITGSVDNNLTFRMTGEAKTDFLKNRIGICVLHPPETCRGKECTITHPDGTQEICIFPENVSPNQPFKNISGMSWKCDSCKVSLVFEGDTFETEDQRNWTDASYKTYCTPLEIPYPVLIAKGTEVHQSVTINLEGNTDLIGDDDVIIEYIEESCSDLPMPSVGICVSSASSRLTLPDAALLKLTGISHLRGEVHLFSKDFSLQYEKIAKEADLLQLPVHLCLIFGSNLFAEFDDFMAAYHKKPLMVQAILLFSSNHKSTPPEIQKKILPLVRKHFQNTKVGAGTNCNFAEFNRMTPSTEGLDFVSFAIHPQEHASDDRTMFENVTSQQDALKSAVAIAGEKEIHISPITLKRRFNANVINYEPHGDLKTDKPDPRQMSLFAAAWTVGSLKYILESGISSVTYYETVGERGLLMGEKPSHESDFFPAEENMVFPVYHIFRFLTGNYKVRKSLSSKPLVADGFIIRNADHGLAFFTNFSNTQQQVKFVGFSHAITLLRLNTENFNLEPGSELTSNEFPVIKLLPYETRIIKIK